MAFKSADMALRRALRASAGMECIIYFEITINEVNCKEKDGDSFGDSSCYYCDAWIKSLRHETAFGEGKEGLVFVRAEMQ